MVLSIMNLSIKVKDKLLRDDEFTTLKTDLKNYRILVQELNTKQNVDLTTKRPLYQNTHLYDPYDNFVQ